MYKTKVISVLACACLLAFSTDSEATSFFSSQAKEDPQIEVLLGKPSPLDNIDQENLAKMIYLKLAAAPDDAEAAFFERYYKLVMEKCPNTDRAHESYWRLTNLYERAYEEPRYEEIISILEQFLSRYQASNVLSMKKYPDEALKFSPIDRLHQAYKALGRDDKIATHYDRNASQEASFSIYDYFDYASALDKTKRFKEAVVWYEKFLKKTEGNLEIDFVREIAADRVLELKTK